MRNTLDRVWLRLGSALAAMTASIAVGAVTIKTEINAQPAMCGQLLHMIKAAEIPQMTNAQLCDFRFATLPPSTIKGFTFPHWRPLAVTDAPAMFMQMIKGNRAPDSVARQPDLSALHNAAIQAAQDHNLAFYTATLPMGARNITFVMMDIQRCSKLPYMSVLDHPFYATYEQGDLRVPVPTDVNTGSDELAFWDGAMLVGISISDRWLLIGNPPATIGINLDNIRLSSHQWPKITTISGGTLCGFSAEK